MWPIRSSGPDRMAPSRAIATNRRISISTSTAPPVSSTTAMRIRSPGRRRSTAPCRKNRFSKVLRPRPLRDLNRAPAVATQNRR
jgi:hypothetical protein